MGAVMRFKWGPIEIGSSEDSDGVVDVITFRQALITTAVVAPLVGGFWLYTLTQPEPGFWRGMFATTAPMAIMMLVFVWLCALLSWLFRGVRNKG